MSGWITTGHDGGVTLKPRSLVLDLFGGYLRYVDAEARLSQLTTLLGAFDVEPATVRVTLSRLRREGWFTTRKVGRETVYRLTPDMLHMLEEGRERIFAAPSRVWTGSWTMVIYQMTENDRQERNQLRKTLAWHGFGPLTTSTWLAPGDRRAEARAIVKEQTEEQVDILCCTSEGIEHDLHLADRCWDLVGLAAEYEAFNTQHRPLLRRAKRLRGAEALVTRTELITTFRHFPFRDPQLPPELRPQAWPGVEAYEVFRTIHRDLGPAARAHVCAVVGREILDPEDSEPRSGGLPRAVG
jgi:phenylacetic acid degradation operon negative regulatory protein